MNIFFFYKFSLIILLYSTTIWDKDILQSSGFWVPSPASLTAFIFSMVSKNYIQEENDIFSPT